MTTLVLADLLADQALETRLKWGMDQQGNWTRYVIARNGNAEHFIRAVPDLDLTTPAPANAKDARP